MNALNRDIVYTIKQIIMDDNLEYLQEYYSQIQTYEQQINYEFIFQKAYLHSCLLHRTKITEWLTSLFEDFDSITKIALKHIFNYGKHLQGVNNPYLNNNMRYNTNNKDEK